MAGLEIRITAPFAVGDVPVEIETDRGPISLWLRDGQYRGDVPGRPLRLRLLEDLAAGDRPPALEAGAHTGTPVGDLVEVDELFDHGVAIPDDGKLERQLAWGCCHHHYEDDVAACKVVRPEADNFGSWEHIMCAAEVGHDAAGGRLAVGQVACWVDATTQFEVGGKQLTFGQIIALAGDFYAHFDAVAADQFAWAWPAMHGVAKWIAGDYRAATLVADPAEIPRDILGIIERDKAISRSTAGEFAALALDAVRSDYPARRYLALASQNICHFASQPPTGAVDDAHNTALALYRAYHARAIELARAARGTPNARDAVTAAIACDAFGCHFLTDHFASGHLRVPRRALNDQFGIVRGALRMANAMHGEDNHLGLWCTARKPDPSGRRTLWRAYGDGQLLTKPARPHLARVQAAVRVSVAAVFAAHYSDEAVESAEDHLPVALRPGDGPGALDTVDGPDTDPAVRNHYPLFWQLDDGRIARRDGEPSSDAYVVLATGERRRFA